MYSRCMWETGAAGAGGVMTYAATFCSSISIYWIWANISASEGSWLLAHLCWQAWAEAFWTLIWIWGACWACCACYGSTLVSSWSCAFLMILRLSNGLLTLLILLIIGAFFSSFLVSSWTFCSWRLRSNCLQFIGDLFSSGGDCSFFSSSDSSSSPFQSFWRS